MDQFDRCVKLVLLDVNFGRQYYAKRMKSRVQIHTANVLFDNNDGDTCTTWSMMSEVSGVSFCASC
jgi:hypothetical protein